MYQCIKNQFFLDESRFNTNLPRSHDLQQSHAKYTIK